MNTFHAMHNVKKPRQPRTLAIFLLLAAFGTAPEIWAQSGAQPSSVDTPPPAAAEHAPARTQVQAQVADAIVAVVNTEVITRQELAEKVRTMEGQLKARNIAMPPKAEMQKQVLERMIVDRAQLQMAKEDGINVDDTMLDRALARIAEQNKMTQQEFRNQLEREGMTFEHFREEIRSEITMQRLREREVDNKIQISESEVDNEIANESLKQAQQEFKLSQIVVRIPENASEQQIAARRKRAEDILRQVNEGGDFAKLAATYSDSADAMNGGDIGWRSQDRLPQLFLDAVVTMKQGDVSPLMKSANGFHIVKLVGKRPLSIMKTGAATTTVEQTHVRHILIKVNQIVTATDARRKLVELKQRLDNKAATFEELAKLYSNDLSASKGGDLGWIFPGDAPEFEEAMNKLKPGEVSEPVQTSYGFHLIQVVERKTEDMTRERKRLAARQAIRERRLEEATQDWVRQVRDSAYVEYRTEDN